MYASFDPNCRSRRSPRIATDTAARVAYGPAGEGLVLRKGDASLRRSDRLPCEDPQEQSAVVNIRTANLGHAHSAKTRC